MNKYHEETVIHLRTLIHLITFDKKNWSWQSMGAGSKRKFTREEALMDGKAFVEQIGERNELLQR